MINCKKIMFFLDENEQYKLLKTIEENNSVFYVKCGNYETNKIPQFSSIDEFAPLISPTIGEHYYSSWLIFLKDMNVVTENITVLGKEKSIVYPLRGNDNAIVYNPGGVYQENYLIHGEFSILSNNSLMLDMFKQIKINLKKFSIKKRSYYVGKETYSNIGRYKRLVTISVKSPDIFDFKID